MKELPTSGQVIVDGLSSQNLKKRDIPSLRRKVGMIFQEFYLLNDRSVYENIALPLRLWGLGQSEIKKRAFKALTYAGLSHKMNETPPSPFGICCFAVWSWFDMWCLRFGPYRTSVLVI